MDQRDDQRRQMTQALAKVVAIAAVLGVLIGGGAWAVISAVGVPESAEEIPEVTATPSALPTRALDADESPSAEPSQQPSATPSPTPTREPRELSLSGSPASVGPGERINLTGSWPGKDNVTLQVQRREGGSWGSFAGVTAQVSAGQFSTWVLTSRTGPARFRVFDPGSGTASNPVLVTIG